MVSAAARVMGALDAAKEKTQWLAAKKQVYHVSFFSVYLNRDTILVETGITIIQQELYSRRSYIVGLSFSASIYSGVSSLPAKFSFEIVIS